MTTSGDRRGDAGLPAVHQGERADHLGRDHEAGVNGAVRYAAPVAYDLRSVSTPREQGDGGAGRPDVIIEGEVVEVDPRLCPAEIRIPRPRSSFAILSRLAT